MKSVNTGGVRVYDLSVGKTLPQWLSEPQKRSLAKDEEYRRRIELVQDFYFNTASQKIAMSDDGYYIVATGVYPPAVKTYDVRELSMKFERNLDAEVVSFRILSEDYSKLVFLGNDRTLSFHAAYGFHYRVRVPSFGRDLAYNSEICELYVAGSSNNIYRLNLELGRFSAPVETKHTGVNVLTFSNELSLLLCGGEDGVLSSWDMRTKPKDLNCLHYFAEDGSAISALCFDRSNNLNIALGSETGRISLFDLRSSKPLIEKQHQQRLPVNTIDFHSSNNLVLSSDAKVIKIWDKTDGSAFTTVEAQADINQFCTVTRDNGLTSGLILCAGETDRMMSFYIPQLGAAPNWCSFLDNLTEELEEKEGKDEEIYENYSFVTRKDLDSLGVSHLLGTAMLRPYMHGFFMDSRLYQRIKAVAKPEAFDEWRKKHIKQKLEEKLSQRIKTKSNIPRVNRSLAAKKGEIISQDERFKGVFNDPDFEIDEESDRFKQVYPSGLGEDKSESVSNEIVAEELDEDVQESSPSSLKFSSKKNTTAAEQVHKIPLQARLEVSDDISGEQLLGMKKRQRKSEDREKDKPVWKRIEEEKTKKENVKALGSGNVEITFVPKQ